VDDEERWTMSDRSEMTLRDHVDLVRTALLAAKGETSRGLRERVIEAARQIVRGEAAPELPAPLAEVTRAIVERPADADLKSLLDAGYSEDGVLELIEAAALGRGLGRMEIGLAALEEA
jgi:hypothetical protein